MSRQVNKPRHKSETIEKLTSRFRDASVVGSKTRVRQAKTNSGIKDTFQEVFTDRIFTFTGPLRGTKAEKQADLDEMLKTLPSDPMETISPVMRIKGKSYHLTIPEELH